MSSQRWVPLESNPDVLNKYAQGLGVPAEWQFADIYGLDEGLLAMVPKPIAAVMMLYPCSNEVKSTPMADGVLEEPMNKEVYYVKQTIGNACGTIALVHALANNADKIPFAPGKPFQNFLDATRRMSPQERTEYLENDKDMGSAHDESAHEGQTKAPSADEHVAGHFITFVCVEGGLYELDGVKSGPIRHGDSTPDTFLSDAAKVVQKFMDRDPEEVNFTLMSLAKHA